MMQLSRHLWWLFLLGWVTQTSPLAAANGPEGSLSTCVAKVAEAARHAGARPYGKPQVDFLLAGDTRAHDYRLPEDGCFGFAAIGHRQVHRLALTVFAPSGRMLARDLSQQAHGYTRFCGKAGREIVVETRMLDGEGEVHLLPLWSAPARLPALEPVVQSCMHAGTPRPSPLDVGPEPMGRPLPAELASMAEHLGTLGYRLAGEPIYGELSEQRQEARRVLLEDGRCYAIAAVGDAGVEDIDLRLLAISDQAILVSSDTTRRRNAVVKVCPEQAGVYVLDVRMYRGTGSYAAQSFVLLEPTTKPIGIDEKTRIPYAEMTARMADRGLRTETLTWGLVKPEMPHTVPIRVRKGLCYAIGAIGSGEGGGDIDLSVLDAQGRLRAAEIGPGTSPMIYDCPEHDETLHAVVRPTEIRKPARFLMVVGSNGGEVSLP